MITPNHKRFYNLVPLIKSNLFIDNSFLYYNIYHNHFLLNYDLVSMGFSPHALILGRPNSFRPIKTESQPKTISSRNAATAT